MDGTVIVVGSVDIDDTPVVDTLAHRDGRAQAPQVACVR